MPIGRPIKLTRELIDQAPDLVKRYAWLSAIADAMGVDRTTFWRWMRAGVRVQRKIANAGRADENALVELTNTEALHLDFCNAIKKAFADMEAEALASWRKAGRGWQASATFCERRWPRKYARDRGEIVAFRKQLAALEKRADAQTPGA